MAKVTPPKTPSVSERLKKAKVNFEKHSTSVDALLDYARLLLGYLDSSTEFGRLIIDSKAIIQSGKDLQILAEALEELLPEKNRDNQNAALFAQYLLMRGLGFEVAGKQSGLLAIKALIKERLPERYQKLGQMLSAVDPAKFPSLVDAHAIKVQAMISSGRFLALAPWPLGNLKKAIGFYRESISEALANPADLPLAVEPIVAHLFLAEALLKENASRYAGEIREHVEHAEVLLAKGPSPWESAIKDGMDNYLALLKKELKI